MSWSITVTPPEGFPDVQEAICSFSHCPGNMYVSVMEMTGKQLREMTMPEAIIALKDLIAEIDKGDEGRFSNAYAVVSDQKWSEGRETMREWTRFSSHLDRMPFKTYDEYCGYSLRTRIRETATRFLLYYVAGYQIEYKW